MNDDGHLCELCDEPCDPSRDMELPDGSFVHQACAEQDREEAIADLMGVTSTLAERIRQ